MAAVRQTRSVRHGSAKVAPSRWLSVAAPAVLGVVAAASAGYVVLQDTTPPPPTDSRPVAVFLGDSFTQGNGASTPAARWTAVLSEREGWREVNLGRGGTGYATRVDEDRDGGSTVAQASCGRDVCLAYADMIEEVVALDPAVVVVSGGQGDWYQYDTNTAATETAINDLYARLATRLPDVEVVAVGPVLPPGAEHARTVQLIDAAVEATAQDRGVPYVPMLEDNVLAGAGLVGAGGFDASDAGHTAIAERVVSAPL